MFIVKVPGINGLGKTKGCRNAGNEIISKLKSKLNTEFLDFEEIHVDNNNLEEQETLIYENSLEAFETKEKIIFLGGDHSVSYPLTKAFLNYCKQNNKQPFLIIFDAHADCMPPMKEPTHEEWLRALIDNQKFPSQNILLIGARDIEPEEASYLQKNKIKQITVQEIKTDIQKSIQTINNLAKNKELYISFDIDIFDSSLVKATGYPSPNGLTEEQTITILKEIIKAIKANKTNLKAFDLVEVNLEKPKQEVEKTLEIASEILNLLL